jgi:hypothetical protein
MLSISEPLHRTRRGYRVGQEAVLMFNFFNPLAGRDNWRQSALEKVQLVSFLRSTEIVDDAGGNAVRFNPEQVGYFGHSQGGIVGALLLGVETRLNAAFLSGAGAGFGPSLMEKTDPIDIASVIRVVASLPEDEPLDVFHPIASLLQAFADSADPINYGRTWREQTGPVPHLIVTAGLLDTFTPPRQHSALAGAFGLPLAEPVADPYLVVDLLGLSATNALVEGNLETVDGAPLTGAVLQYPDHGHFAVFEDDGARNALREFFRTAQDGVPRVEHR